MSALAQYQKIWSVVQCIPVGNIASYGQVADLAGLPGRARLAGKAMKLIPEGGHNGTPVPWHRVLRSSGEIAFELGSEAFQEQRERLLAEGVMVKGRRVSLKQYQWRPNLADMLFSLEY